MKVQSHMDASRDAVQYSVLPSVGRNNWLKSCCHFLQYRHTFTDSYMENLYSMFIYKLQLDRLRRLLAFLVLWSTLMCVLNFVFESGLTVKNICYVILVVLFTIVLLLLHTRYASYNRMYLIGILVLLLCIWLCILSFPVNVINDVTRKHYAPADGVWQVLLTVFIVYTLIPLRMYVAIPCAILLCVLHTLAAIFLAETFPWLLWRQIAGNILLFTSVNVFGIYLHEKTEHSMRRIFRHTCHCITARLEAEEENAKLERLLHCTLPRETASKVKQELLSYDSQDRAVVYSPHVTAHENVSILHANIIGITELSAQCTALELVHILNEVLTKCDTLAKEKHCERIRVQNDVYSCMCGHSESRPDHAKCCVDLAVNLIDFIREIREGTGLVLYLKAGIHTGHVVCGIVGKLRWAYDIYSADVVTSREVMQACSPGKVLISQSTFEYLQGEYDVEPANVWNKSPYLQERQMETFYVAPPPNRRHLGVFLLDGSEVPLSTRERMSYRNMSTVMSALVSGLRPRAELPFAYIANSSNRFPGDQNSLEQIESSYSQQREKLYRYLTQAVTSQILEKSKSDWVNLFTMRFHLYYKEKRFQKLEDESFATTMLCTLVQLVLLTALQATVLPRTLLLLLIFLVGFIWISSVLIFFLGSKLRCISWDVQRSLVVRLVLLIVAFIFIHLIGQINVLCCNGGAFSQKNTNHSAIFYFHDVTHLSCDMPQYVYLSGVTAIFTMAIFFKMATWLKLLLLIPIVTGYIIVIEFTHVELFKGLDILINPDLPSRVEAPMALVMMAVLVLLQGRIAEWIRRLAFLWQDQALEERIAVSEFQGRTRQLVLNMLTSQAALHYVDFNGFKSNLSTYGHCYQKVGLCSISITNFLRHFLRRTISHNLNNSNNNNDGSATSGSESFLVLNDIIKLLDQLLLEDDRFTDVEKIRTSGASYLTAVGLAHEKPIKDTNDSIGQFMGLLVELVIAFKETLKAFNEERHTHFQMRAGMSVGPATIGVVGGRKPVLDIWGYTVYLANLMETSGKVDCIQVTNELVQPLAARYEFQRNSPIFLNGRGETCTHFLSGRKIYQIPEKTIYTGKLPPARARPDSWVKQSPFATPIASFKNMPSDSSINTSGYITQPHTAERATFGLPTNHRRPPEIPPPMMSANQRRDVKESPQLPYGIRLQGLQRMRLASEESGGARSTLTPPSSLHRRRNSGSLTGSEKTAHQHYLPLPPDPGHARVASPDLPMVHFQRPITSNSASRQLSNDSNSSQLSGTILSQSQILSQGSEQRLCGTPKMGYTSPQFKPASTGSNRSSVKVPTEGCNTPTSPMNPNMMSPNRRSNTQNISVSSTCSSADTVDSVVDRSQLGEIVQPACASNSASNVVEGVYDESTPSANVNANKLVAEIFDPTGSEIEEMDLILRELGVGAASNASNKLQSDCVTETEFTIPVRIPKNIDSSSSSNYSNKVHMSANKVQANISKTHVKPSESSSQQISEYENDDASDVRTVPKEPNTKPPLITLQEVSAGHKSNTRHPYGQHSSSQNDMDAYFRKRQHAQRMLSNHSAQGIAHESELLKLPYAGYSKQSAHGDKELIKRMLAARRAVNDDSSSTSSGVCGIPKKKNGHHVIEPRDDDSPPPLPPPPSMEALFGKLNYMVGTEGPFPPHGYVNPLSSDAQHSYYDYNQHYVHPYGGVPPDSAFRPVAFEVPAAHIAPKSRARPVGPVRPIPAMARAIRSGVSTISSTTSDELPIETPRRRPQKSHHDKVNQSKSAPESSNNGNNRHSKQSSTPKSNSHTPTKSSPEAKSDPTNSSSPAAQHSGPIRQDSVTSEKTVTGSMTPEENGSGQNGNRAASARAGSAASAKSGNSKTPTSTCTDTESTNDTGAVKKRPPAPPFQVKRRQTTSQPVRRCRSLDYIPSDLEDHASASSSRANSPGHVNDVTHRSRRYNANQPITDLIKHHVIGDNISISSFESEMSRSDPNLNYHDSSCTSAYESEYDNYRPGMASDEDYFVIEPVSDVDLELFDDINLEEVTVSDKYDIDVHDFVNMNSMGRKKTTDV